jgi:hypothetical protein
MLMLAAVLTLALAVQPAPPLNSAEVQFVANVSRALAWVTDLLEGDLRPESDRDQEHVAMPTPITPEDMRTIEELVNRTLTHLGVFRRVRVQGLALWVRPGDIE